MPDTRLEDGMNILGLVVFSVAYGIVISRMGDQGLPQRRFFDSMAEASLNLITIVIWYVRCTIHCPLWVLYIVRG